MSSEKEKAGHGTGGHAGHGQSHAGAKPPVSATAPVGGGHQPEHQPEKPAEKEVVVTAAEVEAALKALQGGGSYSDAAAVVALGAKGEEYLKAHHPPEGAAFSLPGQHRAAHTVTADDFAVQAREALAGQPQMALNPTIANLLVNLARTVLAELLKRL